jgi:hypothetical protein
MIRKIPLSILESIHNTVLKYSQSLRVEFEDNTIYVVREINKNSDFYFRIIKTENRNGEQYYLIDLKPVSKDSVKPYLEWHNIENSKSILMRWIEFIKEYEKYERQFIDPITESYYKDYENKYDILDEDADFSPFKLEQQQYLVEYLNLVEKKIITYAEGNNEIDTSEINNVIEEVKVLQSDITKLTKRQVVKRLSRIWAQTQKIGLEVLKEVFIDVIAEVSKKLLLGI